MWRKLVALLGHDDALLFVSAFAVGSTVGLVLSIALVWLIMEAVFP